MSNTLTKRALIKKTGIHSESIRYYESIGLLDAPHRAHNGYRIFTEHHLAQLNFIKMCRSLGFSIDTIKQLQNLQRGDTPQHADEFVRQQLVDIEQKIQALNSIKQTLMAIKPCQSDADACNVVAFLQGKADD